MKYGLIQHLKYLFNYKRTAVHLQIDLRQLPCFAINKKYKIRIIDAHDENDLLMWIEVVNDGYDDAHLTINQAKKHLSDHLYLDFKYVFLILDGDTPIATFGVGTYKNNKNIGGSNRLVVKKAYQGKGLGKYIFLLGLNKLKEDGIRYVEHLISIPRKESLMLHFQCGFFPQYNRRFIQHKQKRSIIMRWYVDYKLRSIHKEFILSVSKNFINKI